LAKQTKELTMDQLAPAIKWLKRNVFWLGCGFLSIAMIGVFFYASLAINKETKDLVSDRKQSITQAEAIMNVTPEDIEEGGAHPNPTSAVGMKAELKATVNAIIEAWTIRKKAQEKILVWPEVIGNKVFAEFFGRYNPAETFKGFEAEELTQLLELYKAKIPQHMINLCGEDLLRTHWDYDSANQDESVAGAGGQGGLDGDDEGEEDYGDEEEGGMGMGGMGMGMGMGRGGGGAGMGMNSSAAPTYDINNYAVVWSHTNQSLWNQKMTQFQGRDDHARSSNFPTPLQCYMLQQDLWLLEAMFQIIRDINGGSNANDLSTIKRIDHVVFGKEVGPRLGELTPPDYTLAGNASAGGAEGTELEIDQFDEDMEDMEGDFDDDGEGFDMRGGGGMGLGGGATLTAPYHELYVDKDFEFIPEDVVRSVIDSTELPEENLELMVAKRIPVRIALKMDERKIVEFMAACANSPFAFEIQQVRWNRHTPGGDAIVLGGSNGGGGMGMDSGMGGMGGMGAGGGGRGGGGGGGRAGAMGGAMGDSGANGVTLSSTQVVKRTNYDVNVEFYGIVKIYNPVRADDLKRAAGLDEDEDGGFGPADSAISTKVKTDGQGTPRP
jgi:hypothetical protein